MNSKLLTPFILISAILFVLTACSESSFDQTSKRITHEFENGNVAKSLVMSKNLLKESVDRGDKSEIEQARILLARGYFVLGDYQNAYRFFSFLKNSIPLNITIHDWHKAFFLALEEDDTEFAGYIISNARSALNNYELQIYQDRADDRSIPLNIPKSVTVDKFVLIHQAYMNSSISVELANQQLDRAIKQFPDFPEAYLYKARINMKVENFDIALDDFIKFEKYKMLHPSIKLEIAALALQLSKADVARPYVEQLTRMSPESPIILQLRSMLALSDGDYKNSKLFSEQAIGFGLDTFMTRLTAGMSNFRLKNWEQSNTHLRWISEELTNDHPAKRMLISSKLALKEPHHALNLLREIELNENDLAITNELSKQLIKQGELDKAQSVQNKTSKLIHNNIALKKQHQLINLSIQKQKLKQQLIELIDKEEASDQDKVKLVSLHLADRELSEAHIIANGWYVRSTKNIYAINSLSTVEFAIGNFERGNKLLQEALVIDSQNLPSLLYELQTLKDNEDWPKLRIRSQHFMDDFAINNESIFAYWLTSLTQLKQIDLTVIAPRTTINEQYEDILISRLMSDSEYKLMSEYLDKYLKQPNWQKKHLFLAIDISMREQRYKDSNVLMTQYIDSDAEIDEESIHFIINNALKIENYGLVISTISKNQEKLNNKSSVLVPHVLALLKLDLIDEAKAVMSSETTKTPQYYEAVYEINMYLNRIEQARGAIISSIRENPSTAKFTKLRTITKSDDEISQFKSLIRELVSVSIDETTLRTTVSQWFIDSDPDLTFDMLNSPTLDKILDKDFILANNFAWLLTQRGERDDIIRAKKYAQIARDLAPDNQQVIDTYNKVFGL